MGQGAPAVEFPRGMSGNHLSSGSNTLAVDYLAVLSDRYVDAGATLSINQFDSLRHRVGIFAASIQPQQARTCGKIPIAPAAPPPAYVPRFRALALFGRRPQDRVDSVGIPGVQKPAQERSRAFALVRFDRLGKRVEP